MSPIGRAYCRACLSSRTFAELLRVVDRDGREASFYVDRPTVGRPDCFSRVVGPADRWTIALADAAPSIASGPLAEAWR